MQHNVGARRRRLTDGGERRAIEHALRATGGNVPARPPGSADTAARKLKIGHATGQCGHALGVVAHAAAIDRKIKSCEIRV